MFLIYKQERGSRTIYRPADMKGNRILRCQRHDGRTVGKARPYGFCQFTCGKDSTTAYYVGRAWKVRDERRKTVARVVVVREVTEAEYRSWLKARKA